VQAKLTINQPGDVYEQEADRVADTVMRMPGPQTPAGGADFGGVQPSTVPPVVQDVLYSPGQPLDSGTRAFMEPRFGHDFSQVRVHADERAAESARAVNALAYTVGRDIIFAAGQFKPLASEGRLLLAHELTHVVQQGRIAGVAPKQAGSTVEATDEKRSFTAAPAGKVQRQFITPLGQGGGFGGLMERDRRAAARPASSAAAPAKTYPFSITTDGCHDSPYVRATVVAAARDAFNKVLTSNCVQSESLKDEILSEFDGLNIDCEQGDEDDPCGMASRYFTQTVNIYPKALDASKCGPLKSTILHEVVHLTEWRLFGHGELADACEKSCFGYGSGDASKCV
jgi:hypothetical protein